MGRDWLHRLAYQNEVETAGRPRGVALEVVEELQAALVAVDPAHVQRKRVGYAGPLAET